MGAMMGAINAAMSDKPIWRGALLGGLSTAATYGIGSIFNGVGTFGHELLRAGAHGLSSGVFNALNGDNFWCVRWQTSIYCIQKVGEWWIYL